jgi:tRNA nucleotidyltransferase (CCA-adding enzyme)
MKIELPDEVRYILDKLKDRGYKGYAVGGCVRDSIMGRHPYDWDLTTDATPYEVMEIFHGCTIIPSGIKHGTVTIMLNKKHFEITTFRVEGKYSDYRRPDCVRYSQSIEEDLSRRDFTINAMAYNEYDGLIDIFGGIFDIENKLIRCVGDPLLRFGEDGLRMMRAVRFSSQLDFKIEKHTLNAISSECHLISHVSPERIKDELNRTLLSDNFVGITYLLSTKLLLYVISDRFRKYINWDYCLRSDICILAAKSFENMYGNLDLRLSFFLKFILKPDIIEDENQGCDMAWVSEDILKSLRYDSKTISNVKRLISYSDSIIQENKPSIKKLLKDIGPCDFKRLLALKGSLAPLGCRGSLSEDRLKNISAMYKDIIENNECYKLSGLALNGEDLKKLGAKQGREIGKALSELLDAVIENPQLNSREELIKYIKKGHII